jgi:hypothetical protein
MNLNKLAEQCHKQANESSFYKNDTKLGQILSGTGMIDYALFMRVCQLMLLVISKLIGAMEADRKDSHCKLDDNYISDVLLKYGNELFLKIYNSDIKDTFENEIAGTFIRIFDLCGYLNIDVDSHVKAAMRYSALREEKHGKKY